MQVTPGLFLLVISFPAIVWGHAFLTKPRSRNHLPERLSQALYCPHCGNGGGGGPVKERINNGGWDFPDMDDSEGTHGLCGNPWQNEDTGGVFPAIAGQSMMYSGPWQEWYTQGQEIEFEVAVSTNHKGFFEFRVCEEGLDSDTPSQATGQACLDQHVLQRVDPSTRLKCDGVSIAEFPDCQPMDDNYPTRWHLPPNDLGTQGGPVGAPTFTMWYKLPDTLTCETKCTVQWWYHTANSCHPPGEEEYYQALRNYPELDTAWNYDITMHVCDTAFQSEQFWNCADVLILPPGQTPPPPDDSDDTTSDPPNNPSCLVSLWGNCQNACCSGSNVCYSQDSWYAQCRAQDDCPTDWACAVLHADDPLSDSTEPAPPSSTEPAPPPSTEPAPPPSTEPPSSTPEPVPGPEEEEEEEQEEEVQEGCAQAEALVAYGNCTGQHSGCCGEGLLCYVMDDSYAQCRAPGTCPDCAWDCTVLPAPCNNPVPTYGNCRNGHCCAEGLVCFEQDDSYAQCLPEGSCPTCNSWSCAVLYPGVSLSPQLERRSQPSPRDTNNHSLGTTYAATAIASSSSRAAPGFESVAEPSSTSFSQFTPEAAFMVGVGAAAGFVLAAAVIAVVTGRIRGVRSARAFQVPPPALVSVKSER